MIVFKIEDIPEDFTGEVTIMVPTFKRIIRMVNGLKHCEDGWAMYWLDNAQDPAWFYLDNARYIETDYWKALYKKYRHNEVKARFYMSKILGCDAVK